MKEKPLSLDEAISLCEIYKDLAGQPFCGEYRSLGNIIAVAVSPYGRLDKYYFLQQYKLHGDTAAALASYAGNQFDVVIIGFDGSGQPICRELNAHLAYVAANPDVMMGLD